MSNHQRKRKRVQIQFTEPSMVRPEFQSQQSIHNILKRGIPTPTTPMIFNDNFNIGDKIDTFEKVKQAEEAFMSLPPEIRKNYDGKASLLIRDIEAGDHDRLLKMGVIKKVEELPKEPTKLEPAKTTTDPS